MQDAGKASDAGARPQSAPATPQHRHLSGASRPASPTSPGTPGTRDSPCFAPVDTPNEQTIFAAQLEQQFLADLERCTQQSNATQLASRFSIEEIVNNPQLSKAAWRELEGRVSSSPESPTDSGEQSAGGVPAADAADTALRTMHKAPTSLPPHAHMPGGADAHASAPLDTAADDRHG